MFANAAEEPKVDMKGVVIIKVIEQVLAKCLYTNTKGFVKNFCFIRKTTLWRGNIKYLFCKYLLMFAGSPMDGVTLWHDILLIFR